MILELNRTYHKDFTTGEFSIEGIHLCFAIELAWKDNHRNISCVPEGFYPVRIRESAKFKKHLHIMEVKDRKWILIHPANDAQKELRGCIAPVMKLIGHGKGRHSRMALELLLRNIEKNDKETVFIRITS